MTDLSDFIRIEHDPVVARLRKVERELGYARRVVEASRVPAGWITRESASLTERDMQGDDWEPMFRELASALASYDASNQESKP